MQIPSEAIQQWRRNLTSVPTCIFDCWVLLETFGDCLLATLRSFLNDADHQVISLGQLVLQKHADRP